MDDIFHYYGGYFLMITSHLNEKYFPTPYLDPYGINLVIDEWSSFGDLWEIAFQHPMKCKNRNLIWEDGILHWRSTKVEYGRIYLHLDEWVWVVNKRLVIHLHIYDTGQ